MSATVRAFTPSLDFSEPDPTDVEAEEPEEERLTLAEAEAMVAAAKAAAFEEGRQQGFAEGETAERRSISNELKTIVSSLNDEVGALREREAALFAELEERMARLMLSVVHQLARRLSEEEAMRLAASVTRQAVDAVKAKQPITIRAPQHVLTPLRAVLRMPTDEAAAAKRITFETGGEDEPPQLEVAWLTGKVTFDPYSFTTEIDAVFTETLESLSEAGGTAAGAGEPR